MRMTTYDVDNFDIAVVFAELTFLGGGKDREMIVLLCEDRPVGLCFMNHRIVLSTDVSSMDRVSKDITDSWVHDLNRASDHSAPSYQHPDELEQLIYGYLKTLDRPREIRMGADIGPNWLIEVAFENNVKLLFDSSELLAAAVPGQSVFFSTSTPTRSRQRVKDWVRAQREHLVLLAQTSLYDLVDRHIA